MSKKKRDTRKTLQNKVSPLFIFTKLHRNYCLLIFAFTFLLYANTLNHGYVLDDDVAYVKNSFVQKGTGGIGEIISNGFLVGFNNRNNTSYRPFPLVSFAIEKEIFGNNPKVNHFFNVFYYAIANVLLFVLLAKLFLNCNIWIPLLITILYTTHPIHTEVVANIISRTEIFSFLFSALTLNFVMDYVLKKKSKYLLFGALAYFVCLMSKETGITILFIIPLMIYFFTGKNKKQIIRISLPFAAVALIYMMLRSSILDAVAFGEDIEIINNTLMAANTTAERYATNFAILLKYISLLVFPHPLSWDYSYNQFPIVNFSDLKAILSVIVYTALVVYAFTGIKNRQPIAFGILFYLITLSVTSNLVILIGATLGERFLFTPSLGYCIALIFLLLKVLKINPVAQTLNRRSTLITITMAVVVLYSFKTIDRNTAWRSSLSLFSADVDACPNSSRAHFSLASAYNTQAEGESDTAKKDELLKMAIAGFKKSIEIYPQYWAAWYNLGVAYYNMGDSENAMFSYQKCIEQNPKNNDALNNLGVIYFNTQEYDAALKYFHRARQANPNFPDPYANIGAVYHNRGDYENAIKYYEYALKLNPYNMNINNNLSKAYNAIGNKKNNKINP